MGKDGYLDRIHVKDLRPIMLLLLMIVIQPLKKNK